MRLAIAVFCLALVAYGCALAAIYEAPAGPLVLPEPVALLLGGAIGVVLLLLLPEWW